MITADQMRAARALLGLDQRELSVLAALSVPTIQRMEASKGVVRANVDSLTKLVTALEMAGIEFIAEHTASYDGGRGVRLTEMRVIQSDRKSKTAKTPATRST